MATDVPVVGEQQKIGYSETRLRDPTSRPGPSAEFTQPLITLYLISVPSITLNLIWVSWESERFSDIVTNGLKLQL